jgi:2'-5' RNA ligase
METIRTFIAVPLNPDIRAEAGKLARKLQSLSRGIKWVKPQSMHLTLKFLGNITKEEVQKVFTAMDRLFASPPKPLTLHTADLGAFPNLKRPRVLWIGLQGEGLPSLLDLQREVEENLASEGFPKEQRKFSPHLTLARVKYGDNLDRVMKEFSEYQFPQILLKVERLDIMRSDLKPTGAEYSVQKSYSFLK